MDGGVPWAPDPMEAMDSMRGIISMGNPYHPQATATQPMERISHPTEAVILMHNLFDPSQPDPTHTWTSNQVVAPIQTVYQPQTTESSQPNEALMGVGSMEVKSQPNEAMMAVGSMEVTSQPNEALMAVGTVYHSPVVEEGHHIQKGVLSAEQLMFTPDHVSEENIKDGGEANEYYVPCGDAFDLSQLYAQATHENHHVNRIEFPFVGEKGPSPLAADTESISRSVLSSTLSEDCGENGPSFKDVHSESVPQLPVMIQENSKVEEQVETDGGENVKGFLVMDGDGARYVMSDESSPTIEEQMRAIHGPTPSPVPGLEEASTIISPHISKISPLPNVYAQVAQDDFKSPEQSASVVMDDMLKKIFVGEDATQATGAEDEEVANIMGSPDNNFVNVSQYVVNQSIPLTFDPVTGEMVPDVANDLDKKGIDVKKEGSLKFQQNEAFNDFKQKDQEFLPKTKSSKDKKIAKVKPSSPSKNIAKVAPLPAHSPLQLVTVVSSSATHSSTPRQASSRKCSCAKHSVLGYPPSQVLYWHVRTTPAIRKTIMDFDNDGVKFLYDDGCLKAFETVLTSFTPEFLSAEKSLEVSLCLSCVRWAEGEAKEVKQSFNLKIEKSAKQPKVSRPVEVLFRCYECPAKMSTVKQLRVHLETSHGKHRKAPSGKRSVDACKCTCREHQEVYLAYSRLHPKPVSFATKFDGSETEVKSAIKSLKEKGLGDGEMPLCSYCVHFANYQNTKCVCIKHKDGADKVKEVKQIDFEMMKKAQLVLGEYYEGVSVCKLCLAMPKKMKERENLNKSIENENKTDLTTNVEEKRRKRGRPQTSEVVKKPRTSSENENVSMKTNTSPERVKTPRTSSDNENVYKKEYTSRRSAWIVNEPKKEENKNPKVVMYDLYCDIPGCNARLRGYPSLIKHFKAKHPDESVVSEETKNLNDKSLVSAGEEAKVDDKGAVSVSTEYLKENDKIVAFVNDPSKKLKAMENMKLLNVKVEKLKNMPLPPPSSCLKDKRLAEIHSEPGQGKRKSVEFKETLVIHTISPRRKHETRSRGNETLEMLAPIDLNSPPKPKIIKLNLDDDKNLPNTSDETIAKEKSKDDSNSVTSQANVPNQKPSSELKIHSDETSEAPSTKIVGEKENLKVPKVMLKEIGISPKNSSSLPDQKRKEIDKLRIDMVPEALSPRRGSRSTRGGQKSQAELINQVEPDNSSDQNVPPSPFRNSGSTVEESKDVSDLKNTENKDTSSRLDKLQKDVVSEGASPARSSRSSKASLKSPIQPQIQSESNSSEQNPIVSPLRASRSATGEFKIVENKNSPSQLEKLPNDEVPQVANSRQASRSTRGALASSKSELKTQTDQNAVIIPLRLNRSAGADSRSSSNLKQMENQTPPSQPKQKVHESSTAGSQVRTSRSSRAAPESQNELSNQSESRKVYDSVSSEAVVPIQASRSGKSELENLSELKSQEDEHSSPAQLKDIASTRMSRTTRTESSAVEEIKFQFESKSSPVQKSVLDKLRIDMVSEAISPRRANRSTRSGSKETQVETQLEPNSLTVPPADSDQILETGSGREETGNRPRTDSINYRSKAKVVEPVKTVTSGEVTPRRTRRSTNLEDQKSPSNTISSIENIGFSKKIDAIEKTNKKNSDLMMKRKPDKTEMASGEPMAKATRSGTVATNESQDSSENPTDYHSKDFSNTFANIDAGILTIQGAAKQEGLKSAQMHNLYNQYKADKLKAKSDKIKPSNKMKSKSRIPSNLSSEESVSPPEEEDSVGAAQEAVNAAELPREAINSGDYFQDRSDGIEKVKQDLIKHLSSTESLSVADKKNLLEVVGVINEALLKNL